MKKINKLYEAIDDRDFKTTKTGEDTETGSISWDVSYEKKKPKNADFKESYEQLNNFIQNMVKINGRIKPTDEKLEELLMIMKNVRNRYKRYFNSYQPDWNN